MKQRIAGRYVVTSSHNESVHAFVPAPLPPTSPEIKPESYYDVNCRAELAIQD